MASSSEDRIQISVVDGDAFVWSAKHVERLRCDHGIVGMLVGSLPLIPQQNVFLGLPLQLFEEEVVYLVRRKVAVLVDDVKAHAQMLTSLSPSELREWHQARDRAIENSKEQIVEQARQSKLQWEQHAAKKGKTQEKRKEREIRREQRRKELAENENGEADLFDAIEEPNHEEKATARQEESLRTMSYPVTIPTSSDSFPWRVLRIGGNAFETLSSASQAGLWQYPSTPVQRARCCVFEDLRDRGYFMGKGLRFGGDFVVYPGDPLRYHSHFTATVQSTPDEPMAAQELVAAGRLGTAVKKAHLLCTVSLLNTQGVDLDVDRFGSVEYFSLTWAGFGT